MQTVLQFGGEAIGKEGHSLQRQLRYGQVGGGLGFGPEVEAEDACAPRRHFQPEFHPIQSPVPGHEGLADGVAGLQDDRPFRREGRLVAVHKVGAAGKENQRSQQAQHKTPPTSLTWSTGQFLPPPSG
jgi:hypothetical protein